MAPRRPPATAKRAAGSASAPAARQPGQTASRPATPATPATPTAVTAGVGSASSTPSSSSKTSASASAAVGYVLALSSLVTLTVRTAALLRPSSLAPPSAAASPKPTPSAASTMASLAASAARPSDILGAPLQIAGIYSSTGFDLLGLLARIAARPNPVVHLGPVDLSCAFLVTDARKFDNPIVYVSPTFERLTGYKPSELLGRNCRFLQAQVHGQQHVRRIKNAVATLSEAQFTLINYKKSGEPFMNHLTIIPVAMGETSEITHFVGLQIDLVSQPQAILDRMRDGTYSLSYQAPQLLPKKSVEVDYTTEFSRLLSDSTSTSGSPNFINSVLDAFPDFLHIVSFRGVFLHVSPHASRAVLEYDYTDILSRNISDFVHPATSCGHVNFFCRLRRKKSGYIYMEMNGHMYLGGKRTRCFIMSGRERRFSALVLDKSVFTGAAGTEAWLKLSEQGLVLHASPDAPTILGRSAEFLDSCRLADLIEPTDHTQLNTCLADAVAAPLQPLDAAGKDAPLVSTPHTAMGTLLWNAGQAEAVSLRFFGSGPADQRYVYCQVILGVASSLLSASSSANSSLHPQDPKQHDQASSFAQQQQQHQQQQQPCDSPSPNDNVFRVMDENHTTSLNYEVNVLRLENKRLLEEIDIALRGAQIPSLVSATPFSVTSAAGSATSSGSACPNGDMSSHFPPASSSNASPTSDAFAQHQHQPLPLTVSTSMSTPATQSLPSASPSMPMFSSPFPMSFGQPLLHSFSASQSPFLAHGQSAYQSYLSSLPTAATTTTPPPPPPPPSPPSVSAQQTRQQQMQMQMQQMQDQQEMQQASLQQYMQSALPYGGLPQLPDLDYPPLSADEMMRLVGPGTSFYFDSAFPDEQQPPPPPQQQQQQPQPPQQQQQQRDDGQDAKRLASTNDELRYAIYGLTNDAVAVSATQAATSASPARLPYAHPTQPQFQPQSQSHPAPPTSTFTYPHLSHP
ncbi:hypothetical protein BC831DRAFT_508843 [Entophlyctis helioformis]|nr:hypothetical protein BC831DRAFT_508843 [Entophlyctis helioformis]